MDKINTHQKINQDLSGNPLELGEGYSKVELVPTRSMILDDSNLIHGGFIFGLADYSAMLAINHPFVVLGGANVRFLIPVKLGDRLIAEANLVNIDGKKHVVDVHIQRDKEVVLIGEFYCFIPDKHVLT